MFRNSTTTSIAEDSRSPTVSILTLYELRHVPVNAIHSQEAQPQYKLHHFEQEKEKLKACLELATFGHIRTSSKASISFFFRIKLEDLLLNPSCIRTRCETSNRRGKLNTSPYATNEIWHTRAFFVETSSIRVMLWSGRLQKTKKEAQKKRHSRSLLHGISYVCRIFWSLGRTRFLTGIKIDRYQPVRRQAFGASLCEAVQAQTTKMCYKDAQERR